MTIDADRDLALHPYEGDGGVCAACGEHRTWHPDALPPVPDANLPPWFIAYAEWADKMVVIVDTRTLSQACSCGQASVEAPRYTVGTGPDGVEGSHAADCPILTAHARRWRTARAVKRTNDYAEALAVFERERDRLAEGDND